MKRTAIAAVLLFVAFSVQAAEDGASQWRIGASASFGDFERDDNLISDSAVGFKFNAQYKFSKWFGIEGGYYTSSDFEQDLTPSEPGGLAEQSFKGITLHAIGYIPLGGEDFDLFLKAGYFDFDIEVAQDGITTQTGSDSGFAAGAGVAIHVSDQLGVRTEIDWYDAEQASLWAVSLGVEYRF